MSKDDAKVTLTRFRFPKATEAATEDRTMISTLIFPQDNKTTMRISPCMRPQRCVVRVKLEVDVLVDLYTDTYGNGMVGGIPELVQDQHPTSEEVNKALMEESPTRPPHPLDGFFDLNTVDKGW